MKAIPKLQQGGFAGLFANYAPIQGAQPKVSQPQQRVAAPSSGSGNKDGKLTEKDLFDLMKDVKGLPNDMAALVKNLYEMYTVQIASGDTQNLAQIYLRNLMQLKNNVFNQEEYKKAYEQVKENGGLNEYAITTNGKLVVQDSETKQIKYMTAEELKDSTNNNLQILTNSNLLSLRANSPNLVNDNSILQIVENGIGMEQVAKMVQERFQSLETDETQYQGQTVRLNGNLVKGAEILSALSQSEQSMFQGSTALEGLHSWSLLNKTQQRQAKAALNWILGSLPDNAKTLLSIKAGGADNATNLVWQLIQSKTGETRHLSTNFEKTWDDLTGESKKKQESENSLEDIKLNVASQFLAGYGVREQFVINPGGNRAFTVSANALQLVTKDGDPLGAGCTLQDVSKGQYSGILDWSNMTMGGRLIKSSVYNQIILDDGMIHSIDFPIIIDSKKRIAPDLRPNTLQKKREADNKIEKMGINLKDPESIKANYNKINQVYESCGLQAAYNADGSTRAQSWRRFGVMNAKADGRALGGTFSGVSNKLLSPITDDYEQDALIAEFKKVNKDYQFDKNDSIFEGNYDTFYRGTIWVPLQVNYFASQAGSGTTVTPAQSIALDAQQQGIDRRNQLLRTYNPIGQPNNGQQTK